MAEFMLRGRHNDHVVVHDMLTNPAALPPRQSRLVRRLVVDATAVTHTDRFAQAAHATGTQLLIDPQTPFLTSAQSADDSWARLPFASAPPLDVEALMDPAVRSQLIAEVVEFQLNHGGTAVISPYLHLTETDGTAAKVQRRLILETGAYVHDDLGLDFDVFPIISIDRRAIPLDINSWEHGLGLLLRAAHRSAGGGPYGLGLSSTTRPTEAGLHKMSRIWRRASRIGPFIAWHAGDVGLLAVTMGAHGYEAGMCTAERHNARGDLRNRLPGNSEPGARYTGVYIDALSHSISKPAATSLSQHHAVQGDLGCLEPQCCPGGFASMLGSGRRQHALRHRLADLEVLDGIGARAWRLHHLQERAADAGASAVRIRRTAQRYDIRVGAYPAEHNAMERVVLGLRETARLAIA